MTTHKLPSADARLDLFVAYVTDMNPLLADHREFFSDSHPDGDDFAMALLDAGTDVLQQSARVSIEQGEAKAARKGQADAFATARAVVTDVRKQGAYVISELLRRDDAASTKKARDIRLACAIGSRSSVGSQAGLRRVLLVQKEGVKRQSEVLRAFKQPDLSGRLDKALRDFEDAIRLQSMEQLDADTEQARLELTVEHAAEELQRGIRLVNAMGDAAPETLRRGLTSLEGRHWRVFEGTDGQSAPTADGQPVTPVGKLEPV